MQSLMEFADLPKIIKGIKMGKSDGNLGLFSDHIINGTDKLYTYLTMLFNSMIIHGESPSQMLVGTMVPIPKGKRLNYSISDNFRGICLQSVLCKILDIFILHKEGSTLHTSNLQFGFKKKLSATIATTIFTETVDYYLNQGGVVYALALDASKAFDRVEFSKMFNNLLDRGLNVLYTRLLFHMYVQQTIRVRFNQSYSNYFKVANGVKQGGVLSPTLFTCYIDGLLDRLKSSEIGCFVGPEYVGGVSYADDLIILAPSVAALKAMIQVCEQYAVEYHIKFNGKKSKLMCFDKRRNNSYVDFAVVVNNESVKVVETMDYLGHTIVNDRHDSLINSVKREYVTKINSCLGDFHDISSKVLYNLCTKYCESLYGVHICDIGNIDSFCTEWRKALRRIWKIPPRTHSCLLPHIAQCLPIDIIIYQRFYHFFISGLMSENGTVQFMFRMALNSYSRIGNNIRLVLFKVGFSVNQIRCISPATMRKYLCAEWFYTCKENDIQTGAQIRELILQRDSIEKWILDRNECTDIINNLCTE